MSSCFSKDNEQVHLNIEFPMVMPKSKLENVQSRGLRHLAAPVNQIVLRLVVSDEVWGNYKKV